MNLDGNRAEIIGYAEVAWAHSFVNHANTTGASAGPSSPSIANRRPL